MGEFRSEDVEDRFCGISPSTLGFGGGNSRSSVEKMERSSPFH